VLFPSISEGRYIIAPSNVLPGYALSLSTAQALGLIIILVITAINCFGVEWGKLVQNIFTVAS
jgi:basic amino acid/polyamine antiporter, APA family